MRPEFAQVSFNVRSNMIRNIVFDIGNVLADFRWAEFLADKGFDAEMVERIGKASVNDAYWHEFDRGIMSYDEIFAGFVSNDPVIEAELHQAFDDFYGIVTKRDYSIPWIESFKAAGYRVYYLSNYPERIYQDCREALDFTDHCNGGILSFQDKMVKPDREMYELLLSRYGLVAEECVFMDDLEPNVKAATECGFNAFVFTDKAAAEEELRNLGVNI